MKLTLRIVHLLVCALTISSPLVSQTTTTATGTATTTAPTGTATTTTLTGTTFRLSDDALGLAKLPNNADQAWAALATLKNSGSTPTPALQVYQLLQGAQLAKDFYTAFPSDARTSVAKKTEVLNALQAYQIGGKTFLPYAQALGAAYRADLANSPHDRFDIAYPLELISTTATLNGDSLTLHGAEYLALAARLTAEVGFTQDLANLYLNIARTTEPTTALTAAKKLLGANPSAQVRTLAQQIVNRYQMVGATLPLTLTDISGNKLDLSVGSESPTLVFVWSNQYGTMDLASFGKVSATIPTEWRIVYLSIQSDSSQTAAAAKSAPRVGTFVFDPADFSGYAARTLNVQETPYIYLINRKGVVAGTGHMQDLSTFLTLQNL